MDNSLVQMIVDILRRGKENEAANQGGPTSGTPQLPVMPQAAQPAHGGQPINDLIANMSR